MPLSVKSLKLKHLDRFIHFVGWLHDGLESLTLDHLPRLSWLGGLPQSVKSLELVNLPIKTLEGCLPDGLKFLVLHGFKNLTVISGQLPSLTLLNLAYLPKLRALPTVPDGCKVVQEKLPEFLAS